MTRPSAPKYEIDPETGCWNWTCYRHPEGYGQRRVNNVIWPAHRYAYVQAYGPLEDGYDVHHTCENRACVNLDHLKAVAKDEHAGGKGHGKLTREDATELRRLYAEGHLQRELAAKYGIARSQVSLIVMRRIWKAAA